jgi:capsular exopolysaccharide synthesis family protein
MTVLRRHALWLLLATVAGIAGAWLIRASLPVTYTSTAQVDVEPRLSAVAVPFTPDMGTEQQVATSGVVLAGTARALGLRASELANDLSASVTAGTAAGATTPSVLSIGCTRPDAAAAQRCAAAAAASYIAFRNDYGKSVFTRAHDPLRVMLVTPATRPAAPTGPGKKILLPAGALLGLCLGIGAVFIRDRADDRVRDAADLERCLEAPVLATVPRARRPGGHMALTLSRDPLSPAAEAFRYLRERLSPLLESAPGQGTVLLVAGAEPREGRTTVAANLAAAWGRSEASALLVDADMRSPALSGIFGTGERPGLADLLAGRASAEEVAVPAGVPGLRLVTDGTAGDWPPDAAAAARLTRAFGDMRGRADVVVVDSAPMGVSHALALARACDLAVVVADVRRTSRQAVRAAAEQLRLAGPAVIVGVLNEVRSRPAARGWPAVPREPRSRAPLSRVPGMLAGAGPARGPNGHKRAEPGAALPPAARNRQPPKT